MDVHRDGRAAIPPYAKATRDKTDRRVTGGEDDLR